MDVIYCDPEQVGHIEPAGEMRFRHVDHDVVMHLDEFTLLTGSKQWADQLLGSCPVCHDELVIPVTDTEALPSQPTRVIDLGFLADNL